LFLLLLLYRLAYLIVVERVVHCHVTLHGDSHSHENGPGHHDCLKTGHFTFFCYEKLDRFAEVAKLCRRKNELAFLSKCRCDYSPEFNVRNILAPKFAISFVLITVLFDKKNSQEMIVGKKLCTSQGYI
jgi:hypothetical protein